MRAPRFCTFVFSLALVVLAWIPCAMAQSSLSKKGLKGIALPTVGGIPCTFQASYELEEGTPRGVIRVTATPDPGYHIFSVTQPDGGPAKTIITSTDSSIKLGTFEPDLPPHISLEEPGFEGLQVESHEGAVTWAASFELGSVPEKPGPIELSIKAQVCIEGKCIPILGEKVTAEFESYYASSKNSEAMGPFRESESLSAWTVFLSHEKAKRGETVELILKGTPDPTFHFYKYDSMDPAVDSRTLIVLKQKAGMKAGAPAASKPVVHKDMGAGLEVDYYEGEVEWRIPLQVPLDAIPNRYPISGLVGYQACNEGSCDQPRGLEFRLDLQITENESVVGPVFASIKPVPYKTIAELPKRSQWIDERRVALTLTLSEVLTKFCLAMLGGLILNVMPCVLPVIGLKILGFVSEAAGDRKAASRLTFVYALGIISLIFGLGLLSVIVRQVTGQAYGWGEQFGSVVFRIASTSFMFALALSFLGVWDIPIPGFATGGKSAELAGREGYLGAFFKGLITTILATPCSAPFLGGVFVVALNQPSWVVLLIFTGVGLGMALPYLLISIQPSLLGFIPKPGPWMETFKEFLAFPMLLAVVMFVDGFTGDQKIAMLASLIFVWFACWLIGRVPAWASLGPKLRNWGIGAAVAVAGSFGSFYFMSPSPYTLAWKSYNEETLDRLVSEGKTVLIDFTAEWCQNCKLNLNQAIHTKKVKDWVEKNGVVAMEADMTEYPPHIKDKLNELESISIPVLAIYKPGDTETPIVLRDLLSEKDVLEALKEAGPSRALEASAASVPTSAPASAPSNGLEAVN